MAFQKKLVVFCFWAGTRLCCTVMAHRPEDAFDAGTSDALYGQEGARNLQQQTRGPYFSRWWRTTTSRSSDSGPPTTVPPTRSKVPEKPQASPFRTLFFQLSVPLIALTLGTISCQCGNGKTLGAILIYFGAQTTMNLYVKIVLSKAVIDADRGMKGVPAPFLVTAMQQIVAFLLWILLISVSNMTSKGYRPRRLTSPKEYVAVCCFSFAFVLNVSLNNLSISLLPLSVNLVIRSCLPLSTYVSQLLLSRCLGDEVQCASAIETSLMVCGVVCAGFVVLAQSSGNAGENREYFVLGVLAALGSLFSGAANMALAGILGTKMNMSPLDATGYMSVPASIFLLFPTFGLSHVVSSWPHESFESPATDWNIFVEASSLKPVVVLFLLVLGPMAFAYNILQVKLVQTLSATHTCFAGNFNKAASIALALLFGVDKIPKGGAGVITILGLLGNVSAFTTYSVVKERAKMAAMQCQPVEYFSEVAPSPIGTFMDPAEERNSSFLVKRRTNSDAGSWQGSCVSMRENNGGSLVQIVPQDVEFKSHQSSKAPLLVTA